jgi:PAS domain S-box-containing protein
MNEAFRAVVAVVQRCLERYPDPALMVDEATTIVGQNPAARELFGEGLGRPCRQSLPGAVEPERALLLDQVLRGHPHRGHLLRRADDGLETYFEVTALPLESEGGRLVGATLLFRDVTLALKHEHHLFAEAQDLEREIDEKTGEVESLRERAAGLRDELEQLKESQAQVLYTDRIMTLGQLVAGVAHDIHTPLGALLSNANLFQRSFETLAARLRELPEEETGAAALRARLAALERSSNIIVEAGRRIEKVVSRLRAFSRTDEAPEQLADLHDCLDSAMGLVTHQLGNRITLVCRPDALNQVFLNLLVNAIQAIEGTGSVTVETRAEGDRIEIAIRDTGQGIVPEHLERVFDAGFTTKQRGIGTGLGLAICRRIVADQGGRILIDSEPGQGTTVTVRLPREPASRPSPEEETP